MLCDMRSRKDDIPKMRKREKSWVCERCDLLLFAPTKPVCRRVMLARVKALHASAEADTTEREKNHD